MCSPLFSSDSPCGSSSVQSNGAQGAQIVVVIDRKNNELSVLAASGSENIPVLIVDHDAYRASGLRCDKRRAYVADLLDGLVPANTTQDTPGSSPASPCGSSDSPCGSSQVSDCDSPCSSPAQRPAKKQKRLKNGRFA